MRYSFPFLVTSYFTVQLINGKGKFISSKILIEGGTVILNILIHRVPPQCCRIFYFKSCNHFNTASLSLSNSFCLFKSLSKMSSSLSISIAVTARRFSFSLSLLFKREGRIFFVRVCLNFYILTRGLLFLL